jgi:hypothetical protein
VGLAWKEAFRRLPGIILHDKDGSHPAPLGTYLGACVFYATLFGASPAGLPADASLRGEQDPARISTLQEIAWSVVAKLSGPKPAS